MRFQSLAVVVRRRPLLSAAWAVVVVLLVVQNVRLGRFMIDPDADWWLTTRDDLWAKHACLPAYIEAADLHRQGVTNVYDARFYAVLDRTAKPPLTVAHLDTWVGDPFQYSQLGSFPMKRAQPHIIRQITLRFSIFNSDRSR